MNVTYTNLSAQQQAWVEEGLRDCGYPFDQLVHLNLTVTATELTMCSLPHVYMCTTQEGETDYLLQIEPWADDPAAPYNQGLPDPAKQIHEFFVMTVVHELGHVVQDYMFGLDASAGGKAAACFTHTPDGRRGTGNDFDGGEGSIAAWADRIQEAISEWFRLAYLPSSQSLYWNRTNWDLSADDFNTLFELLLPHWYEYGIPQICAGPLSGSIGDVPDYPGSTTRDAYGESDDADPPTSVFGGEHVGLTCAAWPTELFGDADAFVKFESNGGLCDATLEEVTAVVDVSHPRGVDEPGFGPHLGHAGLSRSGSYKAQVELIAEFDWGTPTEDWGVVQIIEAGEIILEPFWEDSFPVSYVRVAEGAGGELPRSVFDGGDEGAPWGDMTEIMPGFAGGPNLPSDPHSHGHGDVLLPTFDPPSDGWRVGQNVYTTVQFSSHMPPPPVSVESGQGFMVNWQEWIPTQTISPGDPTEPDPPETTVEVVQEFVPSDPVSNEGGQNGISNSFESKAYRVRSLGRSYAAPVAPGHSKDEIHVFYRGWSRDINPSDYDLWASSVAAVFWPVVHRHSDLPAYPQRQGDGTVVAAQSLRGAVPLQAINPTGLLTAQSNQLAEVLNVNLVQSSRPRLVAPGQPFRGHVPLEKRS